MARTAKQKELVKPVNKDKEEAIEQTLKNHDRLFKKLGQNVDLNKSEQINPTIVRFIVYTLL